MNSRIPKIALAVSAAVLALSSASAQPQRGEQVLPDQRKPVAGAYGAEMLTKKGVFGITAGHQNRHLALVMGSWNRSVPAGYKIARVPFRAGRPEGYYENFATGLWASGEERAEVWGRPAALAVAKDGSLLVADDTGGTICWISYKGPPAEHAGGPAESTGSEARKK